MLRRRRTPPQPPAGGPVTRRMKLQMLEPPPPPVDYISSLPNDLLGEIVSLLPVKDGVRTQVLASRWRHNWRSTPLNVDCRKGLVNVSRILQSHPGPGHRFRVMTAGPAAEVDAWLRSPALDSLQELEFTGYRQRMPASTFRCSNTLRALTIVSCKLLHPALFQGLHFPHLKVLGLERVRIPDASLQSMVDGCPTLEILLVHTIPGFRRLRINSSTLTTICVRVNKPRRPAQAPHTEELVVETAPLLQRVIHLYAIAGNDLSVFSATKVETAGILADWHNFYTGLVSCSRTIHPVHTVKSLSVKMIFLSIDVVVDLLKLFPCLEKLHIKSSELWGSNSWRRKHRSLHDIRLKTLVLEPYLGNIPHVNFAKFFVLNARALEVMIFHIEAKSNNAKFFAEQHRKLELENRASRDAQFRFTTATCQHAAWNTEELRDLGLNDPFVCSRF